MDDDIFLGRDRQMEDLSRILGDFFDTRPSLKRPVVILISGQGGIGKSTLLREFHTLAEQRYGSRFQRLHVDWQTERRENPSSFAVDSRQVDGMAVLRAVHRHAADSIKSWKKKNDYTQAKDDVVKAAGVAAQQAGDLRDRRASQSGKDTVVADGLSKTVGEAAASFGGPVGPVFKPFLTALARWGIQVGPELAGAFRDKLAKKYSDLLLDADQHVARGLGEALRRAAVDLPILVTFDTYEIIDECDAITRILIRSAGPRVIWIVAGRRDLYETRTETPAGRVDGYREEDRHAYDVTRIDVTALAREEIREYFRLAAPDRPLLEDDALEKVDRASGAIPLAIKMAAEIWRDTGDVEQILTPEELTAEKIVAGMVGRYEQHCIFDEDRQMLAAIVLADGDSGLLKAILLPEHDGDEKRYREHLNRVRHRYAAVQHTSAREPRLHDEPAHFFRERLRSKALREEGWLREFNDRAVMALCQQIDKLLQYHLRLDELCEDNDYVDAAIKVARHLFWRDEDEAWPWLISRYVEGLSYSSRLRERLLEEASIWTPHLQQRGRKRLAVLQAAESYFWRADEQQARRKLLEDDAKRGWLADERIENSYERERLAIRLWSAAAAFLGAERLDLALESLQSAWQRISNLKCGLSVKIADLALDIDYRFWERGDFMKAREASTLAVAADPSSSRPWRELGTDHRSLKDYGKAIEFHKKALEIDSVDFVSWRELGTDYLFLKDYGKAIEFHKKALEIYPGDFVAWRELGNDHVYLKDYQKAIEHYEKALEINPRDNYAWRDFGSTLTSLGRYEEATEKIQQALEISENDGNTWDWRGYLHMIVGEDKEAARCYERSIAVEKSRPNPYFAWGILLYRSGEWEAAAAKLREAVFSDAGHIGAFLSSLALNRLIKRSDDPPTLLEDTRQLIESDDDPKNQAQWRMIVGDVDLALEKLSQAVRETPDHAVFARFWPSFHVVRDHPRFIELTADVPGSKWEGYS